MNVFIIGSIVVALTMVFGMLLARLTVLFSNMVTDEQNATEAERTSFNPTVTMGHRIPIEAEAGEQLKAAKLLAAKKAAITPRGENMRIGRLGGENQPTAFDGVEEDPISAVKIAQVHGWQLLRSGGAAASSQPVAAVQATAQTVAPTKSPDDLKPGVDYPFIEITDDMDPAAIRKARIANAKARSAAVKALKESGAAAPVPAGAPQAAGASAPAAPRPAAAAPAVTTGEPVPGVDYEVIEITDDMDPAEVRKARIANAKAKSAAMKAFKAAGGGAAAPAQAVPAPAPAPPAQPSPAAAAPAVPSSISQPDYIEITDDMDPADVRKARIQNAKARSAYNKALKEAGIDPATVES